MQENEKRSPEDLLTERIEEFFSEIYDENKLPSHGIEHHRRVWQYARELLQYTEQGKDPEPSFVNKLLIACYLHDIGIMTDPGPRHGHESRILCELFLAKNNLDPEEYADVLESIENHDNKEYTDNPGNKLLLILSVADDLDAFGYTGIYRYIEIYSARGIQPDMIGKLARDNASKRFMNFENNFGMHIELMEKYRKEFIVLDNFFKGYSR